MHHLLDLLLRLALALLQLGRELRVGHLRRRLRFGRGQLGPERGSLGLRSCEFAAVLRLDIGQQGLQRGGALRLGRLQWGEPVPEHYSLISCVL